MAISSTINKVTYACDGSQVIFPFPYKIFNPTDMKAKLTDALGVITLLEYGTHYTVPALANGYASGCNVVTVETYEAGNSITIYRELDPTQDADYEENDDFPAETHETALDRIVILVQQLYEIVARCLKIPITDADVSMELPNEDSRPSTHLSFSAAGLPIFSASLAGTTASAAMIPVIEATTLALARTAMDVQKTITVSTEAPAGGIDGDIWLVREA